MLFFVIQILFNQALSLAVLMKEDSITYAGNQEVQLEDDAPYVYHSSQGKLFLKHILESKN